MTAAISHSSCDEILNSTRKSGEIAHENRSTKIGSAATCGDRSASALAAERNAIPIDAAIELSCC